MAMDFEQNNLYGDMQYLLFVMNSQPTIGASVVGRFLAKLPVLLPALASRIIDSDG
jgi:hypothetical protein